MSRFIRILIYEGYPTWLEDCKSKSLPLGKRNFGNNSITVYEHVEENVLTQLEKQASELKQVITQLKGVSHADTK